MSSKAATQLAGNASSIFQAWLDLKRQTSLDTQTTTTKNVFRQKNTQRRHDTSP